MFCLFVVSDCYTSLLNVTGNMPIQKGVQHSELQQTLAKLFAVNLDQNMTDEAVRS
jgi:hypothetical protein